MARRNPLARAMVRAAAISTLLLAVVCAVGVVYARRHGVAYGVASSLWACGYAWLVCEATPLSIALLIRRGRTGNALARGMLLRWGIKLIVVTVALFVTVESVSLDRWLFGIMMAVGVVLGDNANVIAVHASHIPIFNDDMMKH